MCLASYNIKHFTSSTINRASKVGTSRKQRPAFKIEKLWIPITCTYKFIAVLINVMFNLIVLLINHLKHNENNETKYFCEMSVFID